MDTKERKIRLFVSSTFRDMNPERDYLNNYIFPQIKTYCDSRFIEFTPIDLRWGITEEESKNALVLASCLDEIDNSMPFFVGIIGLYYGMQPSKTELNCLRPSIVKNKEWLNQMIADKASITEIEIEYAALSNRNSCRGIFFVKQDSADMPANFKDLDKEKQIKLKKLRRKINEQTIYPVHSYTDIADMGGMLLKEVLQLVDEEFGIDDSDYDNSIIGRHEASLERHAKTFFEIPTTEKHMERWFESNCPLLVFTGPAGSGTSNTMANAILFLRSKYRSKILYYDFECADPIKQPMDDFLEFMKLAHNKVKEDEWSLIAIDNASVLDMNQIESMLKWIKEKTENLHVFFAASYSLFQTTMYMHRCSRITQNGLLHDMQYQYVRNFAKQYGKKLTDKQQIAIVKGPHSNDPTILNMLMHTLINFGSIEQLDNRINQLVKYTENSLFFDLVIEAEKIFLPVGMCDEFCKAIVTIAMHGECGISEQDMMGMLSIPMSKWVVISPMIKLFCHANPRKLVYFQSSHWAQDVKDGYSTTWVAKVGLNGMEWWKKQKGRLKESAISMIKIYLYIWNLPMDDNQLEVLNQQMLSIMLSPECVLLVPLCYHSKLWSFNCLNTHSFAESPRKLIGKQLSELTLEEKTKYYETVICIAETFNRYRDVSWAYYQLAQVCKNMEQCLINEAYALLSEGKASKAISHVTGFLSDVSGSDNVKLQKRMVRLSAFVATGDGKRYIEEFCMIIKLLEKSEISEWIGNRYILLCTEKSYHSALCGNNREFLNDAIDDMNMYGEKKILSGLSIANPAFYMVYMTHAIIYFWKNKWLDMEEYAKYAKCAAYHAFGQMSYQYGRADILINYAHFKQYGKIIDTNAGYTTTKYKPLSYFRSVNENFADKKVIKANAQENKFYEYLVNKIS